MTDARASAGPAENSAPSMSREKSNVKWLLLGLLLLLAVAAVAVTVHFVSGEGRVQSNFQGEMNRIAAIPDEDKQAAVNQLVEDNEINISYASKITMTGANSDVFNVRNIENNHHPIVFEIFDEEGNSIYVSKPISPGYEMTSIALDEPLATGVHNCRIKIGYEGEGNVSSYFPMEITVQ